MESVNAIPKNEKIWETIKYGKNTYIITTKLTTRDFYMIYKTKGGKFEKLGRAKNPIELEEKYIYK